jgi:hypothetical protein
MHLALEHIYCFYLVLVINRIAGQLIKLFLIHFQKPYPLTISRSSYLLQNSFFDLSLILFRKWSLACNSFFFSFIQKFI